MWLDARRVYEELNLPFLYDKVYDKASTTVSVSTDEVHPGLWSV